MLMLAAPPAFAELEPSGELDLRLLNQTSRLPAVFQAFDALGAGQSVHVLSDHGLHTLERQMSLLYGELQEWEWEEDGPALWRATIRRRD